MTIECSKNDYFFPFLTLPEDQLVWKDNFILLNWNTILSSHGKVGEANLLDERRTSGKLGAKAHKLN